MIVGHIFIQGVISPWQDKNAEEYGEVNIKQVTQQIQDNADAEKLIVHIHSPGGDVDEGFGIHDILVSHGNDKGIEIETRIEGLCASITTVIAMAGSVRKITENSEFMIHNPWGDAWGDSDDVQKYADQLKAVEDKVIDFYVAKTGGDRAAIDQMMKAETWMTADQA
ncbi:MAG: Clp protease ClpP, partial [Candidatus Theseobacter exili]|nr:Clp protease ClpP [Candidatus Theseobacter exili]